MDSQRYGPHDLTKGFITSFNLIVLALVFIAIVLQVVFWTYTNRLWEDALITGLHSINFHEGRGITHVRLDDPKPLHGFTSPISLLIPLVGDYVKLGWGIAFQKLMSVVAIVGAILYAALILRMLVPAQGLMAALILGCSYLAIEHHQILWGMAGMETTCVTAILIASIYYLLVRSINGLGLTLALCMYARPDLLFWCAIAWSFFAIPSLKEGNWRAPLKVVGIALVCYAPWVIFTTYYYGSPIPHTVIAKSLGYRGWWLEKRELLEHFLVAWNRFIGTVISPLGPSFAGNGTGFAPLPGMRQLHITMLALALVGVTASILRRQLFTLGAMIAFVLCYTFYFVFLVPVIFGWYLGPYAAVIAILSAKGLGDLISIGPARLAPAGAVVAMLILAPFAYVLPKTFAGERNIQLLVENRVRKAIGAMFSNMPNNVTIGGEPLGYISYFSKRTYYDYPGLASRRVTNTVRELHKKGYPQAYLICQMLGAIQPEFIVFRKGELDAFRKEHDGKYLENYSEYRWFTVPPEDRAKLLFPERNIDLEFAVLKRNKD